MHINANGMLPELFYDMCTPVNYIHDHETKQAKGTNLYVSFKPTSRGQKPFHLLLRPPGVEFHYK